MRDLTRGSVVNNILSMATPIAATMIFQTLYVLIDLYFVAAIGDTAVAGVGAAGNLMFIVLCLTQVLGVGSLALISQAVGRGDRERANLIFNQSAVIALLLATATLVAGYAFIDAYVTFMTESPHARLEGATYLRWFLPGIALRFVQTAMGVALRATGIVKPTMTIEVVTVLLNIVLTPVLIGGWGTGVPLGVAGAGLASTVAIAAGVLLLALYFVRFETYMFVKRSLSRPRLELWRRILSIGLPAGGEFAVLFVYVSVTYWAISDFGPSAQAGFVIGSRILQSILFVPAAAIALSVTAIAGQNFGARLSDRVRETLLTATVLNASLMALITAFVQWRPQLLITAFTSDNDVASVGGSFLALMSWGLIAQAMVFTCSGILQGMGNTKPALLSSAARLTFFLLLVLWLRSTDVFELDQLWIASVATIWLQAAISFLLVKHLLRPDEPRAIPRAPLELVAPPVRDEYPSGSRRSDDVVSG